MFLKHTLTSFRLLFVLFDVYSSDYIGDKQ